MNNTQFDLASIPGLNGAKGLFGSANQSGAMYNDGVVHIMVYLYDVVPPAPAES